MKTYRPGWYLFSSPVLAVCWIGAKRVQRMIPAGYWELICVSGDTAQLATGGRGYPGQTSRFLIPAEVFQ